MRLKHYPDDMGWRYGNRIWRTKRVKPEGCIGFMDQIKRISQSLVLNHIRKTQRMEHVTELTCLSFHNWILEPGIRPIIEAIQWPVFSYATKQSIKKWIEKWRKHISEIDGTQRLTPFVCISNKLLTEIDFQRLFSINLDWHKITGKSVKSMLSLT